MTRNYFNAAIEPRRPGIDAPPREPEQRPCTDEFIANGGDYEVLPGAGEGAVELAIFSGNCQQGICGEPSGFKDMDGKPLYVGDIVQTFTVARRENDDGEWMDFMGDELTAVVSDAWESTFDGYETTYRRNPERGSCYVMGIRSVPMDQPGEWRVRLVKSHRDVIDGDRMRMVNVPEARRAMGFRASYQLPDNARLAMHMLGNAVSPPAARDFIDALAQAA